MCEWKSPRMIDCLHYCHCCGSTHCWAAACGARHFILTAIGPRVCVRSFAATEPSCLRRLHAGDSRGDAHSVLWARGIRPRKPSAANVCDWLDRLLRCLRHWGSRLCCCCRLCLRSRALRRFHQICLHHRFFKRPISKYWPRGFSKRNQWKLVDTKRKQFFQVKLFWVHFFRFIDLYWQTKNNLH
jgi:hypothetical protein